MRLRGEWRRVKEETDALGEHGVPVVDGEGPALTHRAPEVRPVCDLFDHLVQAAAGAAGEGTLSMVERRQRYWTVLV